MNFITNTLKVNIVLFYCLLIHTVYDIKTQDVYEAFLKIKICLILATIH